MKTERRHELQTNVLADWLGHKTEAIRPYFKLIVGGVAAVFIVAIAATFISNQQLERSSRGWADYFAASAGDSPDRLRSVAEDHAGTLPGLWAMQREADLELARGIRALYTSRGEATDALAASRKLYELVAAGTAGQPVLKQAAQFGSAQAFEAEGELEKAKDLYADAIATAKDSSVGKQAQVRLERLEDEEAAEFLAWFARQTPKPRPPTDGFPGGFPGGGGQDAGLDLPRDLTELPGRPDVSIPATEVPPSDRESALPTDNPAAATPESPSAEPGETAPETKAPEAKAPEAKAPEAKAPETKAPEAEAPETSAPAEAAPAESTTPDPTAAEAAPAEPAQPAPADPPAAADAPAADPAPTSEPGPESPAEGAPAETPADAPAGDSAASE